MEWPVVESRKLDGISSYYFKWLSKIPCAARNETVKLFIALEELEDQKKDFHW
ncbi:MAG: hypothetical protein WC650_02075 [Candidatus Doudnabacteria bacterium]